MLYALADLVFALFWLGSSSGLQLGFEIFDFVVCAASYLYFCAHSEELTVVQVTFGFHLLELFKHVSRRRGLCVHVRNGDWLCTI